MNIRIAFAETDEQRDAVCRLRYDVYVREMHMFGDVADHAKSRLLDEDDAKGRLIYAEVDGEIVGGVRLNWGGDAPPSPEHRRTYGLDPFLGVVEAARILVVTRMIVRPSFRGGPLTVGLLRACAEFGRSQDTTLAFCDCQPHLISFYQAAGFRPYTVAFNDPHFGIMIPLVLLSPDGEYLERIGSPLAEVLREWPGIRASVERLRTLIPDSPPVRTAGRSWSEICERVDAFRTGSSDSSIGFFDGVDESQLRRLLERGHIIECVGGDVVIRRGQVIRTLFVVLDGELEARIDGAAINVIRAGECFGEIAFLHGVPRTVDVVARAPGVLLLALNESVLRSLLRDDPEIAARVLLNMARGLALKLARRDAAATHPRSSS
jgi:predicted GNAT family N-acyltransferase